MIPPNRDPAATPEPPPGDPVPAMPVEELMGQLAQRAAEIITAQQRLRGLLAANRSIVAELSLTRACQRIVEAARETAGARYAAMGVLGPDGGLDTLVHSGMDDDTVNAIESFPVGRGLLGHLEGYPQPVRVADVGADARAHGFPEGHPRMRSFLGVPVQAGGADYGHLYLAEPLHGGEFSEQDEQLVAALAATAGIAVENARLYEESRRRQEWLLASSEISQRLMGLGERQGEDEVWRLITATVRQLADADVVSLIMPVGDDERELEVTVCSGTGHEQLEGLRYLRAGSVAGAVMQDGHRVVLVSGEHGEIRDLRDVEQTSGPAMVLPLRGELGSRGVLAIGRRPGSLPFTSADVDMAEDFAGQAAIATELASARSAQQRLVALEDRERIARDLHDHVIQRLFATGLTLQSTAGTTASTVVRDRLIQTVEELDETIRQIRTSIFALKYSRPTVSSVRATVLTAVDDVAAALGFRPETHLVGPIDTLADESLVTDVSAVLHEALANVVRHARASSASVTVSAAGGRLTVLVLDDGRGMGRDVRLSGLAQLRDRAEQHEGAMTLDEPEGGGTRLTWSVPLT
ncbi:GAF domain-containing sensor histidine kinase [uncultured Friedmanniella sp.]|uniref:GAF domain-containing sensor histidine kinase n=1 Tax=uncultured Friedmanniella sp. TaxID=335381 RepID=UPI0035CC9143